MKPDRNTAPAVKPFGRLLMPPQTVETLSNGLVFHHYIGGDQPVCRFSLHIPGGTLDLGEAQAKLTAAMLTEGSKDIDGETLAENIDFNGARIGVSAHSHHLVVDLAVTVSRLFDMLPILSKMLACPEFPAERLDVARQRLKSQLRMGRMEVSNVTADTFMPLISGKEHRQCLLLTEEMIDMPDSDMLKTTYNTIFAPGAMHAYFSGRISGEHIDAVRAFLEALPALGPGVKPCITAYEAAAPQTRSDVPFEGSLQCGIAAGMPGPARWHEHYVPLRYSVMALGGYFGSRLMTNIREDKGLTYGISAALMGSPEGSYVYIATTADRSYAAAVEHEIKAELEAMRTNPPSGDELERFKLYAATNLAEMLDNPGSIMGYYASMNLVGTPPDYFERQQSVLSQLSPELISQMADIYLRPEQLRIATAGVCDAAAQ